MTVTHATCNILDDTAPTGSCRSVFHLDLLLKRFNIIDLMLIINIVKNKKEKLSSYKCCFFEVLDIGFHPLVSGIYFYRGHVK